MNKIIHLLLATLFVISCSKKKEESDPTPTTPTTPTNNTPSTSNNVKVTTLAGSGSKGSVNGVGAAASFNTPYGLAVDASGNVYVAEDYYSKIRKISPDGVVSTFAGSGLSGNTDGPGISAKFNNPYGVTVDATGYLYVADANNNLIRKISPTGEVSTLAGSNSTGSADGTGTAASFHAPWGVAVDASGNVYVADYLNNLIRKISPAGVVSTLAGSGSIGNSNGTGVAASFNNPHGVAVDASGNVYVADWLNHLIRKISPAGVVSTLAGSGSAGNTDGTGTSASFKYPNGVAVDASGNVYVADAGNHKIRKISPAGVVTTLAGIGSAGNTDGTGETASFNTPTGVAVDATGNVYVADELNYKIRKITQQ